MRSRIKAQKCGATCVKAPEQPAVSCVQKMRVLNIRERMSGFAEFDSIPHALAAMEVIQARLFCA